MYIITVQKSFKARHGLTLPDGSKEPCHEHDWLVTTAVGSQRPDRYGMVMDFRTLGDILQQAIADLQNVELEQVDYFQRKNTSAENIARYVYDRVAGALPGGIKAQYVRVTEAAGCTAEYAATNAPASAGGR